MLYIGEVFFIELFKLQTQYKYEFVTTTENNAKHNYKTLYIRQSSNIQIVWLQKTPRVDAQLGHWKVVGPNPDRDKPKLYKINARTN